ncbi:WecB/TagA/CpsF family glycosyltransferase [Gordonia ajococcus]|uniref:WecB/TagA/CpsF family glycosyltransferase n=1 Tax=Gordonia ajococcus TaxID=1292359 RepID=UPI001783D085|nr:WecB/TagA/CpsF family glycosyltransferase [Gordonia ajococcus]
MSDVTTAEVAGVPLQVTSEHEAVKTIIGLALNHSPTPVRFCNAHTIASADANETYRSSLQSRGINFPDGTPVVWAMRRVSGAGMAERVRGPSVFNHVLDGGREYNIRHAFVGTTSDTLNQLRTRIELEYPGVAVVAVHAPPYSDYSPDFVSSIADNLRDAEFDILWVGLGGSKQDMAADYLSDELGVPALAVGAAFDFVAGTQPEAPVFMRDHGMEWLFRFLCEPKRLWRRYTVGAVSFAQAVRGSRRDSAKHHGGAAGKLSFHKTLSADLARISGTVTPVGFFRALLQDRRFTAVVLYRISEICHSRSKFVSNLIQRLNLKITGADIHPSASLGCGVLLLDPDGVTIADQTVVGDFVTIGSKVRVGAQAIPSIPSHKDLPSVIGACVTIAAGSTVLRGVTIGDHEIVVTESRTYGDGQR